MIDFIIDFFTNNKIATAITIIIGFGTIIGYIFSKKFRNLLSIVLTLFTGIFTSILLFITPNGIIKIINSNDKIKTLRRKCLDKISYSISSKPLYGVYGYNTITTGLISIENPDIFDKLQATDLINFYNKNSYLTRDLLKVLEKQINQGYFDEQIKKMKKEGYLV